MKRLIVISAPSGAGKTTLCKRLLQDFKILTLSISSTTRAPRGQEKDGVDYYFLTKEAFQADIDAGFFAEWANVHDQFYGTSKKTINAAFAKGLAVLLDIDVQGAESLRKAYPNDALTIFISPPSLKTLEERLRSRNTDSEESIQKRMRNAEKEMKESNRFEHVIINDDLDRAYQELFKIVSNVLPKTAGTP